MRRAPLPVVLGVCLAPSAFGISACDPPAGDVMRDATARQVAGFRRDGLAIYRFAADGQELFLKTLRGKTAATNEDIVDIDQVNLHAGEWTTVAENVVKFYEDGSIVTPPAWVTVAPASAAQGFVATISFPDGRAPVTIDSLTSSACCDWLSSPWAVRRYGADALHPTFWIGSFDALRMVDASLRVSNWRGDAFNPAFLVTAMRDDAAAQGYGVWSVPLDGSPPAAVIGPPLGNVVVADPNETFKPTATRGLAEGTVDLQECWSPGGWLSPLDFGVEGSSCYALYQRTWPSGARLLLYDYKDKNERLLPGVSPTNVTASGGNARWVTWWSPKESATGTYTLYAYDMQSHSFHQCDTGAPGVVLWQARHQGAVIVSGPATASEIRTWDLASAECPVVATAVNQPAMVLSPDGSRWAWLETDTATGSKITLADENLANQRVIAQGTYFQQIGFLDNDRMLVWRTSLDGFGYSWIDTSLENPVEHALAEQVFFISSRLDAHQILIGHRYNDQDQNGDLSLIDMDTGAERLVSHGVTSVGLRFEDSTDGGKTRVLDVAFVVKGRYASDQDGLWLAKIPFAIPAP